MEKGFSNMRLDLGKLQKTVADNYSTSILASKISAVSWTLGERHRIQRMIARPSSECSRTMLRHHLTMSGHHPRPCLSGALCSYPTYMYPEFICVSWILPTAGFGVRSSPILVTLK